VVERRGRGMGDWIWVVPGELAPPPTEISPKVTATITSGHRTERRSGDVDDVEGDGVDVAEALEEFSHTDSRPGYSAFYYDPDDEDEIDELSNELSASKPSGRSPEARSDVGPLEVNVLGTVEVRGWLVTPSRKILTELACYLALHQGRPASGEELRTALRRTSDDAAELSAKTLRNNMSELKRSLGAELFPQSRGVGYCLSGPLRCDWLTFKALVAQADDSGADPATVLRSALSLVRGRPFADVDFGWAAREFLLSEMEGAIRAAARRLASHSLEAHDFAGALFSFRRGLLASPFDFALWEGALRAAAGVGTDELASTWRDAQATLGDDASEFARLVEELKE
jgi:hypothetical protein